MRLDAAMPAGEDPQRWRILGRDLVTYPETVALATLMASPAWRLRVAAGGGGHLPYRLADVPCVPSELGQRLWRPWLTERLAACTHGPPLVRTYQCVRTKGGGADDEWNLPWPYTWHRTCRQYRTAINGNAPLPDALQRWTAQQRARWHTLHPTDNTSSPTPLIRPTTARALGVRSKPYSAFCTLTARHGHSACRSRVGGKGSRMRKPLAEAASRHAGSFRPPPRLSLCLPRSQGRKGWKIDVHREITGEPTGAMRARHKPPCTGRTDILIALRLPAEQRQAGKYPRAVPDGRACTRRVLQCPKDSPARRWLYTSSKLGRLHGWPGGWALGTKKLGDLLGFIA